MDEELIELADRKELNYLFSDSISDADLLRAVEGIESARVSANPVAQTSAVPDDIHTTVGVQSVGNVGSVSASESPQIGKFFTFTICISASPVDIGRKLVFLVSLHFLHVGESRLHRRCVTPVRRSPRVGWTRGTD